MKLKLTGKDKKLLLFLGFFLVIAGLGFGVILPLQKQVRDAKEQLCEEQSRYYDNTMKRNAITDIQEENEEIEEQIALTGADFYANTTAAGIDKQLTEQILQNGITVQNLQITMPEDTDVMQLQSYHEVIGDSWSRAEDEQETEDSQDDDEFYGLSTIRVSMDLYGTKDNLDALLEQYAKTLPKMRIVGLSWQRGQEEMYQLEVKLELYMQEEQTLLENFGD